MQDIQEIQKKEKIAVDYDALKSELDSCKKPLFFFHDDPDGLASFLLFYRYMKEGKGIVVKTKPNIDLKFLRKVEEYQPDKIFILDIAHVEQDFVDAVKTPVVWVDHHTPQRISNVKYFNPRLKFPNDNIPVSCVCYYTIQQDEWVSLVGCVGDYYLPEFLAKVKKQKPELFKASISRVQDVFYNTEFGKLIDVFSFVLKGKTQEVLKCVKILTRIKDPDEILKQTTPSGKYIYKRYKKVAEVFNPLMENAFRIMKEQAKQGKKVLFFEYTDNQMSFTSGLSNRIAEEYPNHLVVIGRKKSGELKCSLRSNKINLTEFVPRILKNVDGYGGGHEKAAAAIFKEEYKKQFFENIENELKKLDNKDI